MPHYKKVFDIGTYTGNGGQYRVGIPTLRGVGPTGTQVAGSSRFRSAVPNYLTRTPSSTTNQTTWTFSFWIKRGTIAGDFFVLSAATSNHSSNPTITYIGFNSSDQIVFYSTNNNTMTWSKTTTQSYRDASVWYHITVVLDTTNATSANRTRIYVNGFEIKSWSADSQPSQNATGFFNSSSATHVIGREAVRNRYPFDGYLSEVYFIDGQALTPSSFGEYNSDSIWVPKSFSGTYGTNGFYLPMNSSSNYATDQSGNGNNWTPSGFNITTANTSYDIMTDSPTDYLSGSMTTANNAGNYCTWIPNSGSSGSVIEGGLYYYGASSWMSRIGSIVLPQNSKIYYETTITNAPYTPRGSASSYNWIGVGLSSNYAITQAPSGGSSSGCLIGDNGYVSNFATGVDVGTTIVNGDVIGVAVDTSTNQYTFYKNNSNVASGIINTSIGTSLSPMQMSYSDSYAAMRTNFGQRAFAYTPPTGYVGLNTYNYPRPADSSLWFYGDTPDLMWIKNRTTTGLQTWTDTVRGPGLNLVSSSTAAETSYPGVTEMNKFGMSIINDGTSILNGSTNSHVYWAWKAGSNTSSTSVTNTNGATTSQVSANPAAGFSIVSFTTNLDGSTYLSTTVGHGLSSAPSMIIFKARNQAYSFGVYHQSIGNGSIVYLNATNALNTASFHLNDTSPTSSVFTVGYGSATGAAANRIAYCWTAIPGYSAFGSFTGNGSTDGPFVYLGFRPRWVLIKSSSAITNWWIWDVSRNTFNVMTSVLYPDLSNAEYSDSSTFLMDALSNGFKYRTSNATVNGSGTTYIYAAFAETPFKYARAR